jgi:SAM-dependent methyltransferase
VTEWQGKLRTIRDPLDSSTPRLLDSPSPCDPVTPGSSDDPYADLPALYDLGHAHLRDDVALYLQLAQVVGDPILELGCGTGRVLGPLAAAGHRVVGVDRSVPMLERARAELERQDLAGRVTLSQGDMTEADRAPGGPFGLVLCTLNGLAHLTSASEQRAALLAARRALDPRGMLVLDLLNPTPDLLSGFDGRVVHEGARAQEDGARVDRFASRTHQPAEQRIETTLWYDVQEPKGALRRVRSEFGMRYLMRAEIELLLELTGFASWMLYGSYELDPYDDDSERLLVTAEVTAP